MKTLDLLDAAAFLHLHPDTLQRRAKAGDIPGSEPMPTLPLVPARHAWTPSASFLDGFATMQAIAGRAWTFRLPHR